MIKNQIDKIYLNENKKEKLLVSDLSQLKSTFAIPDLSYIEIHNQEQLNAIIQRWHLLAEYTINRTNDGM